jgi:replicative DNA helicase
MARNMLARMPLYFIEPDWRGEMSVEAVFDKIREAVKRHGIKFLVFDHLHFLCRSLKYVVTEVGQVTRAFKLLCEELQIVTWLIAQPKKVGSGKMITYDDIKDSSAIPADADWVMLMHRKPRPAAFDNLDSNSDQDVLEPKTLIRFDAARFRGGGDVWLYYEGETSRFMDWDARPHDTHQ